MIRRWESERIEGIAVALAILSVLVFVAAVGLIVLAQRTYGWPGAYVATAVVVLAGYLWDIRDRDDDEDGAL